MKRIMLSVTVTVMTVVSCNETGQVWCDPDMWYQSMSSYDTSKVDVLYYVSTNVLSAYGSNGRESWTSLLTPEDREAIDREISWVERNMFHSNFNVISPYYHQYTFNALCKLDSAGFNALKKDVVAEACSAFDYYMDNMNHGRKFIIAGFSQGAMLALEVVKHMSAEQVANMVACYSIGYRLAAEDLQHPNLKAASNASDTGVVVSFNSSQTAEAIWPFVAEGAATCINPVNWQTDSTPATFTFRNTTNTVHVDQENHVLLVDTDNPQYFYDYYNTADFYNAAGVSRDNLHHWDLLFYAEIIHDNALLRSCCSNSGYDVAAYVWPAYHDEPRYAEIGLFGDHKGEWEAIYNAEPKFEGHRQPRVPEWGYFNEASPEMQERIISTALEYGVGTFIFDWYWFEGRSFLEGVLNDGFLKAGNNKQMKFYIMWANHTANSYWDRTEPDKSKVYWNGEVSRDTFDALADHLVNDYFSLPNYYRIDGMPVFAIYDLTNFINGLGGIEEARRALDSLRNKCREAGLGGLHLQAIVWDSVPASLSGTPGDSNPTQDKTLIALGFDSMTNYQWCHLVPTDMEYKEWGEKGVAFWEKYDKEFSLPYFPHVSIDWDPNPRFPAESGPQDCIFNSTPEKFKRFLVKAKEYADSHPSQPRLITVNAWNEWAEGSYLEPDTEFGYGYLEAVKEVFGSR